MGGTWERRHGGGLTCLRGRKHEVGEVSGEEKRRGDTREQRKSKKRMKYAETGKP